MNAGEREGLRDGCHRYCREHFAEGDACSTCGTVLSLLDALEAAERKIAAVEALVRPQWRSVDPDVLDTEETFEAFRMGRNWMIDRLRAALAAEDTAGGAS